MSTRNAVVRAAAAALTQFVTLRILSYRVLELARNLPHMGRNSQHFR